MNNEEAARPTGARRHKS